jgi:hypothetical protein
MQPRSCDTAKDGVRGPLLIVAALPRGGNHLLRGLLDSHPRLLVPPDEDYFVRHLVRSPLERLRGCLCGPSQAPAFYHRLQKNGHLERVNAGRARNSSGTENTIDLDRYYGYVREHHVRFLVDGMIRTHLGALQAGLARSQPGADRVKVLFCALQSTDIVRLGRRLSRLYDVRGIFVFRDPRAHYGSKLGYKPEVKLRRFCRQQNRYWREVERFARDGAPALRVRFEALALDTERTMRGICDFAGIGFSESATRFTQNGSPTASNSSYQNVVGIDPGALTRYREKVAPEALRYIESHCHPELFWPDAGLAPPPLEELHAER